MPKLYDEVIQMMNNKESKLHRKKETDVVGCLLVSVMFLLGFATLLCGAVGIFISIWFEDPEMDKFGAKLTISSAPMLIVTAIWVILTSLYASSLKDD